MASTLAIDEEQSGFESRKLLLLRVYRVADVPQEFASLPLNVQQDRTDFLYIELARNFAFLFYGLFLHSVIELV